VGKMLAIGKDYLIDETTAIVRFIFPIGIPTKRDIDYQYNSSPEQKKIVKRNNMEAEKIRFIFKNIFVKSILDLVNAEDEIWMLERGIKNDLYIWKKKSSD